MEAVSMRVFVSSSVSRVEGERKTLGYEIQVTCFNCTELQSHNWSRFKLAAELVALDSKLHKVYPNEMEVVVFPARIIRKAQASTAGAKASIRDASRAAVELYLNQVLALKILEFSTDLQTFLDLGSLPTAIPWYLQAKQPFRFVSGSQLLNEIEEATGEQLLVSIKQQETVVETARKAIEDATKEEGSGADALPALKRHLAESEIVLSSLRESYARWQRGEVLDDDVSSSADADADDDDGSNRAIAVPVPGLGASGATRAQTSTPQLLQQQLATAAAGANERTALPRANSAATPQQWAKPTQWAAGARTRAETPQRTFLERKTPTPGESRFQMRSPAAVVAAVPAASPSAPSAAAEEATATTATPAAPPATTPPAPSASPLCSSVDDDDNDEALAFSVDLSAANAVYIRPNRRKPSRQVVPSTASPATATTAEPEPEQARRERPNPPARSTSASKVARDPSSDGVSRRKPAPPATAASASAGGGRSGGASPASGRVAAPQSPAGASKAGTTNTAPAATAAVWARALYSFEGDYQTRELSFRSGDLIRVLDKELAWWQGELHSLKSASASVRRGWFPSNYVALLSPAEQARLLGGTPGAGSKGSGIRRLESPSRPRRTDDEWEVTEISDAVSSDDDARDDDDLDDDLDDLEDDDDDDDESVIAATLANPVNEAAANAQQRLSRIIRFSTVLRQQDIAVLNWQLAQQAFK